VVTFLPRYQFNCEPVPEYHSGRPGRPVDVIFAVDFEEEGIDI